jgi:predicted transposase/invertase (TIGR01784 family)
MSGFVDNSGEYDWMLKLSEEKYQLDTQSRVVDAKRQGREEGREEGRERTNLENARKMKSLGISVENICAVTSLSAETIEKL